MIEAADHSVKPIETADDCTEALVFGEKFAIPGNLYIPPKALQVVLHNFSGPLDLLLFLIRKQNINLLDIPIVSIAEQYGRYIKLMIKVNIDLASEYLVMASTLARIKSRMLLPALVDIEDSEEDDPRQELVDRLLEYERFALAAKNLDSQPIIGRDVFDFDCHLSPDTPVVKPYPRVDIHDLQKALLSALEKQKQSKRYTVEVAAIDIQARIFEVFARLNTRKFTHFDRLNREDEGVMGLVVNFFSILCLWNLGALELVQSAPGSDILIRRSRSIADIAELKLALNNDVDIGNF